MNTSDLLNKHFFFTKETFSSCLVYLISIPLWLGKDKLFFSKLIRSFCRDLSPFTEKQLQLDMEQQTSSKSEKEYVKAAYCHPAYLTYMQSKACKMPG